MERGLRAALSPNEARTLRRIVAGMAPRASLAARDVAQLLKLGLVREAAGKLELTAIGRERFRQISGAIAAGSPMEEIANAPPDSSSARR
jgi:hypothetical protein